MAFIFGGILGILSLICGGLMLIGALTDNEKLALIGCGGLGVVVLVVMLVGAMASLIVGAMSIA